MIKGLDIISIRLNDIYKAFKYMMKGPESAI